ncbi:hypothetical protein EVAR_45575_1 [Eumeta japonica]|uniref:Uncharacterized protein n=1 Tax=Eumeta variegata TaxID=151549 RepID=A0A4C1YR18_EUMVA|nr:hypothetical protein EVAR_45575_1 [Eumeta japonica]
MIDKRMTKPAAGAAPAPRPRPAPPRPPLGRLNDVSCTADSLPSVPRRGPDREFVGPWAETTWGPILVLN